MSCVDSRLSRRALRTVIAAAVFSLIGALMAVAIGTLLHNGGASVVWNGWLGFRHVVNGTIEYFPQRGFTPEHPSNEIAIVTVSRGDWGITRYGLYSARAMAEQSRLTPPHQPPPSACSMVGKTTLAASQAGHSQCHRVRLAMADGHLLAITQLAPRGGSDNAGQGSVGVALGDRRVHRHRHSRSQPTDTVRNGASTSAVLARHRRRFLRLRGGHAAALAGRRGSHESDHHSLSRPSRAVRRVRVREAGLAGCRPVPRVRPQGCRTGWRRPRVTEPVPPIRRGGSVLSPTLTPTCSEQQVGGTAGLPLPPTHPLCPCASVLKLPPPPSPALSALSAVQSASPTPRTPPPPPRTPPHAPRLHPRPPRSDPRPPRPCPRRAGTHSQRAGRHPRSLWMPPPIIQSASRRSRRAGRGSSGRESPRRRSPSVPRSGRGSAPLGAHHLQ